MKCIPERLALKQQLITKLDALAAPDTIIASNSSSFSCGEIIEGLKLKHPERVLSAHPCKYMQLDHTFDILIGLYLDWPPETNGKIKNSSR